MAIGTEAGILVAEPDTGSLAGKYLTFRLGAEEYGVEILRVKEIIGLLPITAVPRMPEFIRGVINLRGKIIPVLDLRQKFGMGMVEHTELTCVVVVEARIRGTDAQMGALVDSVSDVVDITDAEIESAPDFGANVDTEFILGMAKHKSSVKILLNIQAVLSEAGVVELATATSEMLARPDSGPVEGA